MIGCVINLCGSVVINIGTNLIKYHHTQQDPQLTHRHTPFFSSTQPHPPATPSPPTHSSDDDSRQHRHLHHPHHHHHTSPHSASSSPVSAPSSPHSSHRSLHAPHSPHSPQSPNSLHSIDSPSRTPPRTPRTPRRSPPKSLPSSSSSTSHPSQSHSHSPPPTPPTRSLYWYLGFTLFFIGNVSNFISMGFTAQSLLAGLGSIQFITNVLCSSLILKHPVTTRVLYATFAIVVGNVLIVAFASHHSEQLTVDQLWLLYTDNTPYQVYCAVLVVLILALYVYYKVRVHSAHSHSCKPRRPCTHTRLLCCVLCQEMKKRLRAQREHARPGTLAYKLLPFSYAAISAIIGTQSVLLAKSSSELVRTTLGGNNQFYSPFTYFILTAWITSMVFWLYRMNAALRKFDGVFIIPVLQVVWTLFSIIGGGVYFKEFSRFDHKDTALFTLGVLIVIFGVYLLAPQTVRPPEDVEDGEGGVGAGGGGEERLMHISSHPDTEMTSVHSIPSRGPLHSYQIAQILTTHPTSPLSHKYAIVSTRSSSRPSSATSPAAKPRSFSFSSSHSSPSDSQTDPDSPTSSDSSSPERHSLSPSTPLSRTTPPPPPLHIQLAHEEDRSSRHHQLVVVAAAAAAAAAEGMSSAGEVHSAGYGGVDDRGGEGVTPKRGRTRGMSLGFSIPLIEMEDQV